ncbi:MAG: hypothetical protein ABSH19_05310 [Opitutales bacterium]
MSTRFLPATGTPEQWSEAYARTEDYLRAHRLRDRIRLHEFSRMILQETALRHAANPAENPVTLAMRVAQERLDQWFSAHLGQINLPLERQSALGRMAFLACDGLARYQHVFLDDGTLPQELEDRLRHWSGRAGPNLEVSSMAPRGIDLGLVPEVAEDTWDALERRPYVRLALLWTGFTLAMLTVYFFIWPTAR